MLSGNLLPVKLSATPAAFLISPHEVVLSTSEADYLA